MSSVNHFLPAHLASPALLPIELLLSRMVCNIVKQQPQFFARLGEHANKRFFINPTNLPLAFLLEPRTEKPRLRILLTCKESDSYDVRISGSFSTLLDMAKGDSDGDALFFSRALCIEGDTGAVVALRNALDNMDHSLLEEILLSVGMFAMPIKKLLVIREKRRSGR